MPNITGTENGDTLNDTAGDDIINALGGDDTITLVNGRDEVHGGAGIDTLILNYADATTAMTTYGGVGQPTRPEPDGSGGYAGFIGDLLNRFVSFDGIEKFVISTGSGNDIIQLPNGANATSDIVSLGGGNDEVALGRGVDVADGGAGIDGLDADLSQVSVAISIDLNLNTYTGVAGGNFTNFEYFTDRDGGFRTGTGNDNVVTRNTDLDDNVRLGAGNDSVTLYDGTDFVVGYGLDTAPNEGGFDTLVVDYSAATANITTDGGFLQVDANGQGWDGRITDGGSRFAMFYGFDRFDITTGSGNDVFNYFNLTNDADNIFHLGAGNDSVNLSQSTGDNYLDGGTGNDTMTGGFGNDTYVVDSASDVVNDFFGGIDEVRTTLAFYALNPDLENLTGTGNVVQTLVGNASANVIDGGLNGDTIRGLAGNDTLKVTGGTTGADTAHDYVEGGADNDLLLVDYSALTAQIGLYVQSDGASGATGFADVPDGNRVLDFTEVERLQITTGTGNDTVNGFQGDDVISTGAGNDLIIAGAGNDQIDGGTGADDMRGGDGNDSYVVDDAGDQIAETASASSGVDIVRTSLTSYTLAANVENLAGTSNEGQVLHGNAGMNIIDGGGGNDLIFGGRGDTLRGNGGDDVIRLGSFVFGAGLTSAQGGNGGNDGLIVDFSGFAGAISTGIGPDAAGGSSGVFTDAAGMFPTNILVSFQGIEYFGITGSAFNDNLVTGAGGDLIAGAGGNDAIDGGDGTDIAEFSGNRDDYDVTDNGDGTYTVVDTRDGSPDGTDTINHIEFVRFRDSSFSIAGLFDQPPVLSEPTDQAVTYTEDGPHAALLQGVILTDPDNPANFAGGSLGLTVGGAGGGLNLRTGSDFRVNANGDGTFSLAIQEGPTQIGIGTISGIGTLNVQITGLTAQATPERINNLIDDFIYLNLSQTPAEGDRIVMLTFTDAAANMVTQTQTLTVVATDDAAVATADAVTTDEATVASGNVLANDSDPDGPALTVSAVNGSAANVGTQIALASGALLTVGADGAYSYDPNHAFDATPTSGSGASNTPGHDTFNYTVAGGNTVSVNIIINGLDTNDLLLGTAGADTLFGGGGDDIYVIDSAGDRAIESAGGGNDVVYALVSYQLAAGSEIERLSSIDWTQTGALNLTGNELGNLIEGNAGANLLNGAGGADVMVGFGGDDIYVADNGGDRVIEAASGGNDVVYALADYALTLSSEVERLSAIDWTQTGALNLTGNGFANLIEGNAGANVLNGGGGADTLVGFGGNDVYVVDNGGDQIVESAAGGNDIVYALANYTLNAGANVERLSSIDWSQTNALNLTGNELANTVEGNAGANVLNGGGGNDVLVGFGGADNFAFTIALGAGNVDLIADFVSGTDRIALDDAVFTQIGGLGALNAGAFVTGTAAADADDRIVYNSATGQLFYDADGNGAGAAVLFATLTGAPILVASDFTVI